MQLSQLVDYLVFAFGVGALHLSVAALTSARLEGKAHPLVPLGLFAIGLSAAAWLRIVSELVDGLAWGSSVQPLLILAAALALAETPRRLLVPSWRLRIYLPLAGLVALGVTLGDAVLHAASHAAFAAVVAATGWALLRRWSTDANGPVDQQSAKAVGLVLLGLAATGLFAGLAAPAGPFFAGTPSGALWLAVGAILLFACGTLLTSSPPAFKARAIAFAVRTRAAVVVLLLAALVAGLPSYFARAGRAHEELVREGEQTLHATVEAIAGYVSRTDVTARLLATHSAIVQYLASPDPAAHQAAELAIDRLASVQPSSIAYLMDGAGLVLLSSNRALPDSLVARSFAEQPYFADAAIGYQGRYLEPGASPADRGYHSSHIVRDAPGRFLGVAAIKADVERWNLIHEGPAVVFVLDPRGIVFLSNRPELELRSLAPLDDPAAARRVADSRFFGPGPLPALLPREPGDGDFVAMRGIRFLVLRSQISVPGWSVAVLAPAQEMNTTLLLSLAAVFIVCAGLVALLAVQHVSVVSGSRVALTESRYRTIVDGAPVWISLVDGARCIVMANPAGALAWGGEPSRLSGVPFAGLWPEEARPAVEAALQQAQEGRAATLELPARAPGGKAVVWSLALLPAPAAGGDKRPQVLVIGEDVTARRVAERSAFLTERLAAVGTLAAGVAHRFNNINMGLMASLEALERMPDAAATGKGLFKGAKELVRQAGDITGRLLEFARPATAEKSRVLLGAVVSEVMSLFGEALRGEGIDLRLQLEDGTPVLADTDRIKFVIVSLVSNAREAVAERAVRQIAVSTGSRPDGVFLQVSDSGPGLAPGMATSLFNPFYTTKGEWADPGSAGARTRGLGLSLSVCQAVVQDHGGRIEAANGAEGGAVFTMTLPPAPVADQAACEPPA